MINPFVSIIVPVYKVEKYIRECIESIVCQDGEWELILVDDGSPDGCPAICDEYAAKDERVRVIHKENGGVSTARNIGLDAAKGDWIWFVDGDDYIKENSIRQILSYINKCRDCDLIQMGMQYFTDGEYNKSVSVKEYLNKGKSDLLLHNVCFHNPRMLFKRSLIEENKIKFTSGVRVAEDQEFQLKCMMKSNYPIQIPIDSYVYRQRLGSATHDANTEKRIVDDTLIVLNNLYNYIVSNNISPEDWLQNRLLIMVRSLLYAASNVRNLDKKHIKNELRVLITKYRNAGFNCFKTPKIYIASFNLTLYFLLNKIYLKIKGLN